MDDFLSDVKRTKREKEAKLHDIDAKIASSLEDLIHLKQKRIGILISIKADDDHIQKVTRVRKENGL